MYRAGLLASYTLSVPVIVVGNRVGGGAGTKVVLCAKICLEFGPVESSVSSTEHLCGGNAS